MGWFDEQIRQRKQKDQELFEDAILRMARAVVGEKNADSIAQERIVTREAIDDILKFYHKKPAAIPASIKLPEEQLEYALRPYGIMYRMVRLTENWYKQSFGPMIAYEAESGAPIPVFPKSYTGYWYKDARGNKVTITKRNAGIFAPEARCFYRPLPLRSIGVPELLVFMKQCLNAVDAALLIGISLLVTLTGMVLPRLARVLTGFVPESGSSSILLGTAAFVLIAILSKHLMTASRQVAVYRIRTKVSIPVVSAVMMRVLTLPAAFFRNYSSGELASRIQSMMQLTKLLVENVVSVGLTAIMSLLYLAQISSFAPGLVWPSVAIMAITLGVMLITSAMQQRVTKKQLEYSSKENGKSFAMIAGVQKIKLTGAEKRAFSKWAEAYTKSAEWKYNPLAFLKINTAVTTAVSLMGTLVLYLTAVRTKVTPSDYIAFSASYGVVMGAFTSAAGAVLSAAQIKPLLDTIEPILNAEPELAEDKEILTGLSGSIELSNVYFRYDEDMPYILDGLNLKVKAGEYLAIVGKTGCGKSTLVRLLLGFETPEKGAIYYDGRDMADIDLRSLRRHIGSVTQNGSLLRGDIFTNIIISAPQLTVKDAWEAAETAGIADDIHAMPMGIHTVISEGQGGISGGQRQRLMIARAIASKPKILIFDEATSALDNRTQKQVSEALDGLNCTRIVIAHRLSTIRHCDRILVLDGGKIVEDGTYDELIARNGQFAELVERQRIDDDG